MNKDLKIAELTVDIEIFDTLGNLGLFLIKFSKEKEKNKELEGSNVSIMVDELSNSYNKLIKACNELIEIKKPIEK